MHLVHKSTRSNWFYANVILTILILAFFFISVVGVEAHTTLENTSPKSQERLNTPPSAVELWFQDEVEVSSHSIKITNHEGAEVQEEVWINPEDDKHVTVTLKEDLPPGEYRVSIHVLTPDGDPLRESFSFMVKEPQLSKEEMWRFLQLGKSSPGDGVIVKLSPEQIELWLTQPAELSAFGLFDDHQGVVPTKEPYVDPENPKHYIVELEEDLSSGAYSVHWYATIEGKSRNGVFYFAVNEVSSIVYPDESFSNDLSLFHMAAKVRTSNVAYWMTFIGLLTLFGGSWFYWVIAKQKGNHFRWNKVASLLYGLSMIGMLFLILHRWFDLTYMSLVEFISLRFVWVPVLQIIVLSIGYWLTRGKLQILLYGLAVLLWTLTGHSAQPCYGGTFGIAMDALHLFGVSFWIGGLLALLIMTPKEGRATWLKEAGRSYSKWAFVSLIIIIISGLWMTMSYVPSFTLESMLTSNWGKMIWLKVVLSLVIISLGYFQRRFLYRFAQNSVDPFFKRVRAELIVGGLILFAAALLITFSPSEAEQGVYPKELVQAGIEASVEITPFKVGLNDIIIRFPLQQEEFEQVRVTFSMPPQWKVENTAFPVGDGVYQLTGNFLHSAGTMYIDIEATTSTGKKVVFPFRVQVPGQMP